MKHFRREISVFSTSAVDLFASALGAFILLVMLLFPFYRHAGPESAPSDVSELIQNRRLALRAAADMLARISETENQVADMDARADALRRQMVSMELELFNLKTKVVEEEPEEPAPMVQPEVVVDGVEFSLLGIATEQKSFVIVIDMSGSMSAYADLMIASVLEILAPLRDNNQFAILGYSGMGSTRMVHYPGGTRLARATPENLRSAISYTKRLANNFGGSTPTHQAMLAAMQYPADAIILISDGQPDSNPNAIISDVTSLNRRAGKEIHTVALGEYTSDMDLVLFLQRLARQNHGDFVGVSR
jgi:hypothetical protein